MSRNKEVWLGIMGGLIMPLIGVLLIKISFFPEYEARHLFTFFLENDKLSSVLALSLILNGGLFYLFLRLEKENSAQGVIISTFLWAIVCVWLKFNS